MYFKTSMGKKVIKLMLGTTLEKMGYKNFSLKTLKMNEDSYENDDFAFNDHLNSASDQPNPVTHQE